MRGVCPFPFNAASGAVLITDPVSILLVLPCFNVQHTKSGFPH